MSRWLIAAVLLSGCGSTLRCAEPVAVTGIVGGVSVSCPGRWRTHWRCARVRVQVSSRASELLCDDAVVATLPGQVTEVGRENPR